MRGVTIAATDKKHRAQISTHTPHAGRDVNVKRHKIANINFNSHAPCGA